MKWVASTTVILCVPSKPDGVTPESETVFPVTKAGFGADASVTVTVAAVRATEVIAVPGVPVPNAAWVMFALVVANGVAERLVLTAHAPVQVYIRRGDVGLAE